MLIEGSYFTIKDVNEDDMDEILEVYRQCEDFLALGPVPCASRQMILDDFKLSREEGGVYCGIFVNGTMAGVFDFVSDGFEGVPEHASLSLLMISASHRSKGLGRAAVEAVEKEILKNKRIRAILSGVQTNNKPGITFWTKMEYQIVSGPIPMSDKTIVYQLRKDIK